jgi:hypothetical protein
VGRSARSGVTIRKRLKISFVFRHKDAEPDRPADAVDKLAIRV